MLWAEEHPHLLHLGWACLVLLLPNCANNFSGGSEGGEEVVEGHLAMHQHIPHLGIAVVAVEGRVVEHVERVARPGHVSKEYPGDETRN